MAIATAQKEDECKGEACVKVLISTCSVLAAFPPPDWMVYEHCRFPKKEV